MRFRLLGPVECLDEHDRPVALSARQRTLLAALLLNSGRTATTGLLIGMIWDVPPPSAAANLRTHIGALRRRMGPGGAQLLSRPGGYRLDAGPDSLDVLRFRELAADAERALREDDLRSAAERFAAALDLWRGDPLEDLDCTIALRADADRLDEERLHVLERHHDVALALGEHAALLPGLHALVREHPLRERLRAQLMLALHRAGRPTDALAAYADVRALLAAEHGIDPGAELAELHRRILAADPGLTVLDPPAAERPAAPAGLPPAPAALTGRDAELAALHHGLTRDRAGGERPAVWMISGAGGTGKTALAVQAAHQVREHYPDGQLFAALRDARGPARPVDVLGRLLRSLGVRDAPVDAEERAALYRNLLADRRVLVVLDGAADAAGVRPLIPGGSGNAVLVTGRPALTGLDAAGHVSLRVLSAADGIRLLERWVGADRTHREADEAARIAHYCGGLPLALRIAAAQLAARPHWPLRALAERLADERTRLSRLSAGDLDVRAGLALGYDELDPTARRLLRLLSRVDCAEFPAWIAAPLLDIGVDEAEEIVEALAEARLLDVREDPPHHRFRLHDLTRAFGREQPEDAAPAALRRLADTWLGLAEHLNRRLPHHDLCFDAAPGANRPGPHVTALAERVRDPVRWFDAMWPELRATVEQCAALGLGEHAWRFAAATAAYQDLRADYADWAVLNRAGLDALHADHHQPRAVRLRGEAVLLQQRGVLDCRRNDLEQAARRFAEARRLFASDDVTDAEGEAYAWHGLGWTAEWRGQPAEARGCHEQAISAFATGGNVHGALAARCSLAAIGRRSGRFDDAVEHLTDAMTTARALADDSAELSVCLELGRVERERGDTGRAAQLLRRSLALAGRLGDRDLAANLRLFLAEAHLDAEEVGDGGYEVWQALGFFHEAADDAGIAWAYRLLSRIDRTRGRLPTALRFAEHALAIVPDLPAERARARRELACCLLLHGRAEQAREHWDAAQHWFAAAGFDVEAHRTRLERHEIESDVGSTP
ncbi:BTAD domain-containing putative transcriptional regulator [Saccharopolyspora sp. NPDC047091]|uniref:AfsR/SARP family transcriptional regulator n=1 Tax=Saccharopolyspora sp. NPDC047091 TaxID=3155924 RepID=UPI0033E0D6C5